MELALEALPESVEEGATETYEQSVLWLEVAREWEERAPIVP
jgi:hypothetical protein